MRQTTSLEPYQLNTMTYQITEFTFAGLTLTGFKSVDGHYYLNQTQIGALIGKDDKSFSRWSRSKQITKKYGDIEIIPYAIPGENHWKIVETQWASKYLLHWIKNGDERAEELMDALTESSFNVMIENSIAPIEAEKVSELTGSVPLMWGESREFTKQIHMPFQNSCIAKGHPAAKVHDLITTLVSGKTAEQARKQLELVNGDELIGLNHQSNPEILRTIGAVKLRYAGLKAGTWEEQVKRAYEMVTGIKA